MGTNHGGGVNFGRRSPPTGGQFSTLNNTLNDMLVRDHVLIPLVHRGRVSAHAVSLCSVRLNTWDSELWNIADWYRATADGACR